MQQQYNKVGKNACLTDSITSNDCSDYTNNKVHMCVFAHVFAQLKSENSDLSYLNDNANFSFINAATNYLVAGVSLYLRV